MNPKQLFLQNADATKFLLGAVNNRHFQIALMHAKSQWIDDKKPGSELVAAVGEFVAALMDLPIDEGEDAPVPTPKLNHALENTARKPKQRKEKKS